MPVLDFDDKNKVKEYNEFVRNNGNTSFMQDLNWANVKKPAWKSEAVYLEENGKIVAAMSLLIQRIKRTNISLMYAPRGPVCDTYDLETVNKLINEAEPLAKKYNSYALKFDPQVLYTKELDELYRKAGYKTTGENPDIDEVIQPLHDGVLHLEGKTEEELLSSFTRKTRYNIRLSGRKGIKVRYSRDIEDLKVFFDLYKITTVRDKIGARDYDYFEKMLEAYDENHLRIYIAEHENDKLSAAIATCYGGELYYVYGASSNEKRNLMPNYAMQMEMIKWGLETNCKTYNFGGILHLNPDDGLYKFKTGFCREEGVERYFGEINKVYKPFINLCITELLPILKKIKRMMK